MRPCPLVQFLQFLGCLSCGRIPLEFPCGVPEQSHQPEPSNREQEEIPLMQGDWALIVTLDVGAGVFRFERTTRDGSLVACGRLGPAEQELFSPWVLEWVFERGGSTHRDNCTLNGRIIWKLRPSTFHEPGDGTWNSLPGNLLAMRWRLSDEQEIPFQIAPFLRAGFSISPGKVLQVEQRRFNDVLVVKKRFGVLNGPVFCLIDMMLLPHVVVPVHALSQET
jgi:hypothetical protein